MLRNSYGKTITEVQTLAYILRFVSEGKTEKQIIEVFNGDKKAREDLDRDINGDTFHRNGFI